VVTVPEGESDWGRFAEKVQLALETGSHDAPSSGTSGLEVEFNLVDRDLRPLEWVGTGPERRSFADYLHDERLPDFARDQFQLEVFHWMTETATPPCWSPWATAAVARVLEGVLADTLAEVALGAAQTYYAVHGPALGPLEVSPDSVPAGWNLAHRRYLARCVRLFGRRLATAGVHTNHSYPDALLEWDFLHLPLAERRGRTLEHFRNQAVIRATRLLRPLCPVFIAISAASPLDWEEKDGGWSLVLTSVDSNRLLAFPNPADLDVPGLYASHEEYLRRSYDLVRSGTRFGGNNWTPVRARSDVDPVNRNINATSSQLRELYRRGIYPIGHHGSLEEAEQSVIIENLCARVDLPMNRVEVRTDEGGDDFDLAVAKIAFKELLMLWIYADPAFGSDYGYGADDVDRSRRNEDAAARHGLDAVIEDPATGRPTVIREWLGRMLEDVRPLAEALDSWESLEPLRAMAAGGDNPAAAMRRWLADHHDLRIADVGDWVAVPAPIFREWLDERTSRLSREVATIAAGRQRAGLDLSKLEPLLAGLERRSDEDPGLPIRIGSAVLPERVEGVSDRVGSVLQLATELIRIPSVTNCPDERLAEVDRCGRFVAGWLRDAGLEVRLYDSGRYPAVLAGFPGQLEAPITLCGHFDVVKPEPDDSQFRPRIEGDWLWGRGAADMKTVVASYMVWMASRHRGGGPAPPINLLLVGNEENGEAEAWGTPQVLADRLTASGWAPDFMVVGERTGESGNELFGAVCPRSRGVVRMRIVARGQRGHSGTSAVPGDLVDRLIEARTVLGHVFPRHLTLSATDGWESGARFPFLAVGEPGVYNITAGEGVLGIELRPIPEDDIAPLMREIGSVCDEIGLGLEVEVMEPGVSCPLDDPHLAQLVAAVERVSGQPAVIGRKKPGSSARFAPGGRQVVWGQTGIGPHSREERHWLPSIEPYLEVMDRFADFAS
jgi:acetylornithine deacetylase/succinyl-diaminopimelate desuccinylase-like protein/gamma-glutamyl:cysteine ligase YbdK (ATP-grasp superfamily)